jgi:hypothetical protein
MRWGLLAWLVYSSTCRAKKSRWEKRGSLPASVYLGSAHTRRQWGRACASSRRQLVGRASALDVEKENAVHCASWIDAVWERKHQTVAGSGRGSALRQLARGSRDLTLVQQQKKKDGRCCWTICRKCKSHLQLRRRKAGPADCSCSKKKRPKSG